MKDRVKFGVGSMAYVMLVYTVGSYLGYRVGRSRGKLEVYSEQLLDQLDKTMDKMRDKFPEYFNDEESH